MSHTDVIEEASRSVNSAKGNLRSLSGGSRDAREMMKMRCTATGQVADRSRIISNLTASL